MMTSFFRYDSEQFVAACNQAWKDLRRENDVRINGEPMVMGSDEASDELRARLRVLFEQSRAGVCVRLRVRVRVVCQVCRFPPPRCTVPAQPAAQRRFVCVCAG